MDENTPQIKLEEPSLDDEVSFLGPFTVEDDAFVPEGGYDVSRARRGALNIVNMLEESIKTLPLGSDMRKEKFLKTIASMRTRSETPRTLIALCGATGAGKSSLINALLGERIVPTSGRQACTSFVTEIVYNPRPGFQATIEFLSLEEWQNELRDLLADLQDQDGVDHSEEIDVALDKVRAVYPSVSVSALSHMTAEQLVAQDSMASAMLGQTGCFFAPDVAKLTQELSRYIRPRAAHPSGQTTADNATTSPAYWPLIRYLRISVHSPLLACGAVIVDLPGLGDSNAARNQVAQDFVKKADRFFIVAPVTRAVSDKIATDLCGQAFRSQLQMDGKYHAHAITFVATKCDEISVQETLDDPYLSDVHADELEAFEQEILNARADQAAWREITEKLETSAKDMEEDMRASETLVEEYRRNSAGQSTFNEGGESSQQAAPPHADETYSLKRQHASLHGSDCERPGAVKKARTSSFESSLSEGNYQSPGSMLDADTIPPGVDGVKDSGPPRQPENAPQSELPAPNLRAGIEFAVPPKQRVQVLESHIMRLKTDLLECMRKLTDNRDLIKIASDREWLTIRKRVAFCAAIRSKWAKGQLQSQFRAGLDEMEVSDIVNNESGVSEHREKPLPVFTVSSRDCMRLEGKLADDGQSACFFSKGDTGIVALRKWLQTITLSARERAMDRLLTQLQDFIRSVHRWIDGIPGVTPEDREELRRKWSATIIDSLPLGLSDRRSRKARYRQSRGAIVPRLLKDFEPVVDGLVADLSTKFSSSLRQKCQVSAKAASGDLLTVADAFVKGMRYNTYRAILHRNGEYYDKNRNREYNLNLDLASPFAKRIARVWSEVFKAKLLKTLEERAAAKVEILLADVVASVPEYLKTRARDLADIALQVSRTCLLDVQMSVEGTLDHRQRQISRSLMPFVKKALSVGYAAALNAPTGVGSYARQKNIFNKHLEEKKHKIYHDAAKAMIEELEAASVAVGKALDENLEDVAKQVQVDIAILWEECPLEGEEHTKARLQTKLMLDSLAKEVDGWIRAKQLRDADSENVPTSTPEPE